MVARCSTLMRRTGTSPSAFGLERLHATGTPGSRPCAAGIRSTRMASVCSRWAKGIGSHTVTSVRAGSVMADLL